MDLLTLAGMAIRPAIPADARFVTLSWLRSGERAFTTGAWRGFDHLAARAGSVKANPKALRALYNLETPATRRAIGEAIDRGPLLVVYDVDQPSFLVGWATPSFAFVSHTFRRQGIARALRAALAAR